MTYFLLVIALTIPFWLLGDAPLPVPVKLPVSALALINPLLAAIILTYRQDGFAGVKALFKRVVVTPKMQNKRWYAAVFLINPIIFTLAYFVMRLVDRPLPADPQIPWAMAPVILILFFIAGIGEELGWMGYAFDPMESRWGVLKAAVILGVFWAVFHLIPDIQNQQPAIWIFWHRVGTVAVRILIVWVYTNTGRSVFAAILFHAMNNLSWALFPNYGSHYDPMVTTIITLLVTAFILIAWKPSTLPSSQAARYVRIRTK